MRVYNITHYCIKGSTKNKIFTSSKCNATNWGTCYKTKAECDVVPANWKPRHEGTCKDAWHTQSGTGSEGEGKCTT